MTSRAAVALAAGRSRGGNGPSPRLNFRTTPDLYDRAVARARREGKTVSQIAREALEKFVK